MAEGYWTYKIIIDPLTSGLRREISNMINRGATVLDIACGTGSLLDSLSPKIKYGTGIDLNESKIEIAGRLARKKDLKNINFLAADATSLNGMFREKFDYVVLSLALHQFPEPLKTSILEEAVKVGKKLIIADYTVPVPSNISGFIAKKIESIAGEEHYSAYKDFVKSNGMEGLIGKNGLILEKSIKRGFGVFTIVKLSVNAT